MTVRLAKARQFLARNARTLERLRFSFLFDDGERAPYEHALRAYQNRDGGFGHGLEPDLRTPLSQPVPTWSALWMMDEIGRLGRRQVGPILRYLEEVERPGGGVPFVLRSARAFPHAPWWEAGRGKPRASINPTAGIAAALLKHRVTAPWLDRATTFSWRWIDRLTEVNPYELRVILSFLDHVPDRARARASLERLRPLILGGDTVELDVASTRDTFRPLDYAPEPGRLSRELFTSEEIERQLDGLERAQGDDGGWNVSFPIWTPITRFEWRGVQTVEMMKVLKSNGRLGSG